MRPYHYLAFLLTGLFITACKPSKAHPIPPENFPSSLPKQTQDTHPPTTALLAHATNLPQDQIQPFLDSYCIRCHGPKKQKGDVRFDQADWTITNNDTAQRWQDVLDQLNGGDMPPEDEDQPTTEELTALLSTLTGSLQTAHQRLIPFNRLYWNNPSL